MSRYSKWARREHSEARRIALTLLAGPVFLGLLPFLVAAVGPRLDRRRGPSIAGTALVLGLAGSLLVYLKRLEKGELAERFGGAYLAYRREVPFMIPRPPKRAAR